MGLPRTLDHHKIRPPSASRKRIPLQINIHQGASETESEVDEDGQISVSDKIQIIGLGSVLITTVAFAAAFTFPGGYNSNNEGTPLLGRRYMFRTFILANTLAFILAFASIFSLVFQSFTRGIRSIDTFMPGQLFLFAASCMVVAFGTGSYVILVPIDKRIATIVLVCALVFGSPAVFLIDKALRSYYEWMRDMLQIVKEKAGKIPALCVAYANDFLTFAILYGLIFGLAHL